MKNIVLIAGSNSKNSINRKLAHHAASKLTNVKVESVDLSKIELPLYGPDLEAEQGIPEEVTRIDETLKSADGLIVSLAEYNGSYATAFKNLFDWLSRINMKVWKDKAMLLMSTSPGRGGGKRILEVTNQDFPYFGARIVASFSLPSFNHTFVDGDIVEPELKTKFEEQIELFEEALNERVVASQ